MLLDKETKEEYGYDVKSLSKGAHKKVVVKCDYCGMIFHKEYRAYWKGRKIVEKDSCKKCRYKKREDISLKQYGVKNSAQRPEVRKKISDKCEGFDEKRKAVMRKRYGTDNAMKSDELKERHKQSIMDKYGVDHISKIPEVRKKVEETNMKKFGATQFFASDAGKKAKVEGMQKKYGVDNAFQSEEIKEKIKQTNLKKYGVDHYLKVEKHAMEHGQRVLKSKIAAGSITLYDGKPISEWRKQSKYSDSAFRAMIHKFGFEVAMTMTPYQSSLEQLMKLWLDEQHINYKQQFHVENKIADFFLPDYNIIIEVDGLYWHSDLFLPDDYHFKKRELYEQHGYRAFFFREHELHKKFNIVTSILNNAMGKSRKIFARKCTIVSLDTKQHKEFCNKNHLMGEGSGIAYGLKYEDELVSIIIIRKIRNNDYDISRFCHTLNTQVVGAYSRLLTHFKRQHSPDSITTFVDKRYGDGSYLSKLGFSFATCSPSFGWTDGLAVYHRLRFGGNTGYSNGLAKIWDCGQAKYSC